MKYATRDIIRGWLAQASARVWAEGELWYYEAHDHVHALAKEFGVQPCQAAAVLSVLSPGCRWNTNKEDARRVLEAWQAGDRWATCNTYKPQVAKAFNILDCPGTDVDMVALIGTPNARKTIAFYWNMLKPDVRDYVTLDRWTTRATLMSKTITHPTRTQYAEIQQAFQDVALEFDMIPCQTQAIVWLVIRDCGLAGQQYLM